MKTLKERMMVANVQLAPFAVPHNAPLGRSIQEEPDITRFPFQRDRDRLIHTQSFRRLKHKTQVFVVGKGDHYRTRLTHTMEVAQVSRDMARTLGLNEDLAECIALAHDLGHTPFGHAGEDAMNKEMQRFGGTFEHNVQSLRVVTLLEERTKRYHGLNLNQEVLEGLMKHRTAFDSTSVLGRHSRMPSLEAQIVNLADEIAYTAHDVDDGLRAGLLHFDNLRTIPLFAEAAEIASGNQTEVRGALIHFLITDAYEETEKWLEARSIRTLDDVYHADAPLISFSEDIHEKLAVLRTFLWGQLYNNPDVLEQSNRGQEIIHSLFRAYEKEPPVKVLELQKKTGSALPEAIKDYIAGMTDQYAMEMSRKESMTVV